MNFIRNKLKSIIATQGAVYFKDFESRMKAESILSGKMSLKDLELKPESFDMKDQPFKIESGTVGELNLNIPLMNLFNDQTVVIISDVQINITLRDVTEIRISSDKEYETLKNEFKSFVEAQFKAKLGGGGGGGLGSALWPLKKAMERIFENLQVKLSNFVIKITNDNKADPFELRVGFSKLNLVSTNANFQDEKGQVEKKGSMVVDKALEFSNFHINLRSGTDINADFAKTTESNLFKYSFKALIRIRLSPLPNEPQYQVKLEIMKNEIKITQWQLKKLMKVNESLSNFSQVVLAEREKVSMRPEKSISEVSRDLRKQITSNMDIESKQRLARMRHIWICRWWKFTFLKVLKNVKKEKKEANSELLKVLDAAQLDKAFAFRIPDSITSVYQESMNTYVDSLINTKFDLKPIEETESKSLDVIDLRSLLFTLSMEEVKAMALKRIIEVIPEYKKKNSSWLSWGISYVPFVRKADEESFEDVKEMMKKEAGEEKNEKFNSYMLKVNIRITQFLMVFEGGGRQNPMSFQIQSNNLCVGFKKYESAQIAAVTLKSFDFSFGKLIMTENEYRQQVKKDVKFSLMKSSAPDNGDFFTLDFNSATKKNVSETDLKIVIEHIDITYVEELAVDLKTFFSEAVEDDTQNEAWDKISDAQTRSKARMSSAIKQQKSSTIMNVTLKSPRIILPLTGEVAGLTADTNMFILHLGDLYFVNEIKPGAFSSDGNTLTTTLKDFRIEFWEDYQDAIESLDYEANQFVSQRQVRKKPVPSFSVLSFSCFVELNQKGVNKTITFVTEDISININPYIYQNFTQLQEYFDLKKEESVFILTEKKKELLRNKVFSGILPIKHSDSEKYEQKVGLLTNKTLYVYNTPHDVSHYYKIFLPKSSMHCKYDTKTGAYIITVF